MTEKQKKARKKVTCLEEESLVGREEHSRRGRKRKTMRAGRRGGTREQVMTWRRRGHSGCGRGEKEEGEG